MPYYQSGLRNRLCYEITFNEYRKSINAVGQTPTPDVTCKIKDITSEYEIVTQLDLARNISEEYKKMAFLCHRVIRYNTVAVNMSNTT